jgi:hypothetical protein
VAGGAEFSYHGDFDWGGIRIASAVRMRLCHQHAGWQPWRYDRDAYETLASAVSATFTAERLPQLVGDPVATPWDPGLGAAMTSRGLRVEEELTLDNLLTDLSTRG